ERHWKNPFAYLSEPDLRARCQDKCMGRANLKISLFSSVPSAALVRFASDQRRLLEKFTTRHAALACASVRNRTRATNVVRKWSAGGRVAAVRVQHLA